MVQKGVVLTSSMFQNLHQSLRCAAVAFTDKPILSQISGEELCPDKLGLCFCLLDEDGGLGGEAPQSRFAFGESLNILALNGSQRLVCLQHHVSSIDSHDAPTAP